MAFAITVIGERLHIFGDVAAVIIDVDITSYTNPGGETFAAAQVPGLSRLDMVMPVGRELLDMDLKWIGTALRLSVMSTGLELGNTLDGGVWRLLCIGK